MTLPFPVITVTSDVKMDNSAIFYMVNCINGNIELTLPPTNGIEGIFYCIKRFDYNQNASAMINVSPGDNFNGDSSYIKQDITYRQMFTLISQGLNSWQFLSCDNQ